MAVKKVVGCTMEEGVEPHNGKQVRKKVRKKVGMVEELDKDAI